MIKWSGFGLHSRMMVPMWQGLAGSQLGEARIHNLPGFAMVMSSLK
jgi:hypothetical protein